MGTTVHTTYRNRRSLSLFPARFGYNDRKLEDSVMLGGQMQAYFCWPMQPKMLTARVRSNNNNQPTDLQLSMKSSSNKVQYMLFTEMWQILWQPINTMCPAIGIRSSVVAGHHRSNLPLDESASLFWHSHLLAISYAQHQDSYNDFDQCIFFRDCLLKTNHFIPPENQDCTKHCRDFP